MAITVRKSTHSLVMALVAARNTKSPQRAGTNFHYDITSQTPLVDSSLFPVAVADVPLRAAPTDLPTCLLTANECKAVYNRHVGDPMAHKVADIVDVVATAAATDLPTTIALVNAIKAAYNLHIASATYHPTVDGTNAIAATNASDLATSITLITAMQTAMSAHVRSGSVEPMINVVAS